MPMSDIYESPTARRLQAQRERAEQAVVRLVGSDFTALRVPAAHASLHSTLHQTPHFNNNNNPNNNNNLNNNNLNNNNNYLTPTAMVHEIRESVPLPAAYIAAQARRQHLLLLTASTAALTGGEKKEKEKEEEEGNPYGETAAYLPNERNYRDGCEDSPHDVESENESEHENKNKNENKKEEEIKSEVEGGDGERRQRRGAVAGAFDMSEGSTPMGGKGRNNKAVKGAVNGAVNGDFLSFRCPSRGSSRLSSRYDGESMTLDEHGCILHETSDTPKRASSGPSLVAVTARDGRRSVGGGFDFLRGETLPAREADEKPRHPPSLSREEKEEKNEMEERDEKEEKEEEMSMNRSDSLLTSSARYGDLLASVVEPVDAAETGRESLHRSDSTGHNAPLRHVSDMRDEDGSDYSLGIPMATVRVPRSRAGTLPGRLHVGHTAAAAAFAFAGQPPRPNAAVREVGEVGREVGRERERERERERGRERESEVEVEVETERGLQPMRSVVSLSDLEALAAAGPATGTVLTRRRLSEQQQELLARRRLIQQDRERQLAALGRFRGGSVLPGRLPPASGKHPRRCACGGYKPMGRGVLEPYCLQRKSDCNMQ